MSYFPKVSLIALSGLLVVSCSKSHDAVDDMSEPTVTSITPDSGGAGDIVSVVGDHFTGLDSTKVIFTNGDGVFFNTTGQADITQLGKQLLRVKVPSTDLFQKVYVVVKRGTLSSSISTGAGFNVLTPYWELLAAIPLDGEITSFAVGNTGYFFNPHGSFHSFDPSTQSTTTLTQLTHADLTLLGFATDTKGIIVLDGPPNQVWEYDPSGGTWSQKNNCPFQIHRDSFWFRIGSKVYLSGGSEGEFLSYDGSNDSWTKLADYPGINGSGAKAVAVNGIGYCFAGGTPLFIDESEEVYSSFDHYNGNWKYDPALDQWSSIADTPGSAGDRSFAIVVPGSDKIYLGGGISQVSSSISEEMNYMYTYSITSNQWNRFVLMAAPGGVGCFGFFIGDKGYYNEAQGTNLFIFKPDGN